MDLQVVPQHPVSWPCSATWRPLNQTQLLDSGSLGVLNKLYCLTFFVLW